MKTPIEKKVTVRFRTDLRRVTGAMLRAARKQHALDFRNATKEIEAILRTDPRLVTEEEERRWILHPDELVALTFARLRHESESMTMLFRRALDDADAEGVTWTPLLDALQIVAETASRYRTFGGLERRLERRLTTIRRWARQVVMPEELLPLTHYYAAAIRRIQLKHANTIPESHLAHWVTDYHDVRMVLDNKKLMARHAAAIVLHILGSKALRDCVDGDCCLAAPSAYQNREQQGNNSGVDYMIDGMPATRFASTDEEYADRLADCIIEAAKDASEYSDALDVAVRIFMEKLPRVRPETVGRLLQNDAVKKNRSLCATLVFHPNAPKTIDPWVLASEVGFEEELIERMRVTSKLLRKAWKRFGTRVAYTLFYHPSTPEDVGLEIVRAWDFWTTITDWDPLPRVVLRPLVGIEMLSRKPDRRLAYAMLRTLSRIRAYDLVGSPNRGRLIEEILRVFLSSHESRFEFETVPVKWIQDLFDRKPFSVSKDVHAALLAHRDPEVRLLGISLTGFLKHEETPRRRRGGVRR